MEKFLEFMEEQCYKNGWYFDLYYSSIMDWYVTVGYKATHPKHNEDPFIHIQSCDLRLAIAKAEVEMKEWLSDNQGGY